MAFGIGSSELTHVLATQAIIQRRPKTMRVMFEAWLRSNLIKAAVVGGEGIGPEVTAQSQRVLKWFVARRNLPVVQREAHTG